MTVKEIKDKLDEILQAYPFLENSRVKFKPVSYLDEDCLRITSLDINDIEVDKSCNVVINVY